MSDWQVGDLAVCVVRGKLNCPHRRFIQHDGASLPSSAAVVTAVLGDEPGSSDPCGCEYLYFADGLVGVDCRFRKIRPDEHEACEPEFITLLKRLKVSA